MNLTNCSNDVAILKVIITRVADAATALRHSTGGVRVLARNAIAGVAGDDTARIQGMWGACVDVYDRPMLNRVLELPNKMLEYINSAAMPVRLYCPTLAQKRILTAGFTEKGGG